MEDTTSVGNEQTSLVLIGFSICVFTDTKRTGTSMFMC